MPLSSPRHLLILASSAERRQAAAREWLVQRRASRPLVVAPSRRAASHLVRGIEGEGMLGVERLTLLQLASSIVQGDVSGRGRAPASAVGSLAMVAMATRLALERGNLRRLAAVAELPNFPRALRHTLLELRLAGIDRTRLRSIVDRRSVGGDSFGDALEDLAVLLEDYEGELEERELGDRATVLAHAALALGEAAPNPDSTWCGRPALYFDLAPEHYLERELLRVLADDSREVLLTGLPQDDAALALGGAVSAEVRDLDQRDADPRAFSSIERARRYLFAPDAPSPPDREAGDEAPPAVGEPSGVDTPDVGDEASRSDGSVVLFSAAGEGPECVEIARQIRDLALAGVPWDRIGIGVRNPVGYMPLLIEALNRAGIDAYYARGTQRPDPGGRAFLALLECAREDLSAHRFSEYLSLGQVPMLEDGEPPKVVEIPWVEPQGDQFVLKSLVGSGELAPDVAPAPEGEESAGDGYAGTLPTPLRWERLIVDAAVVGGRERWQRRLRGLEAELERRAQEAEDDDPSLMAAIERDLHRLAGLRRFALPLVGDLADLPLAASWGVWLDRLQQLAVRSLRRPDSVLQLLAELRPMAEVGPVGIVEVVRTLSEHLTSLTVEPRGRSYGKVFVGTIEELAGLELSVVFVPGLAEGVFPRRASEDPLLLDEDRRLLSPELAHQDARVRQERRLLRVAVGAATDQLVASYPRIDSSLGRARVPSLYALEIVRSVEGAIPSLAKLARRAERASATRVGRMAPERAPAAIDTTELDLSLLRPLLDGDAQLERGQARFLLDANPALARSLRSRGRRWRRRFTYADGLVASSEHTAGPGDHAVDRTAVAEVLAAHQLRARSYSPTALQHYAACPYRFFLQAILRLRPRVEVAGFEQLDPLTKGSIFHQVQFELQNLLAADGLLPVRLDNLQDALRRADVVVDRVAAEVAEELAPAVPRVWSAEVESLRNDLRGWLYQVAEAPGAWRPEHFELAFGLPLGPQRDRASRRDPVAIEDGALLRGSIDLVEVLEAADAEGEAGAPTSAAAGRPEYRVTDHKTGRTRAAHNLRIAGGEILQPVFYALVAERLLAAQQRPARVTSGRLFYCTQKGGFEVVEVPLDSQARAAAGGVLQTVDAALGEGFFPAAPRPDACRWCDYRSVCGPYEEQRLMFKDPQRLEPLHRLREQP